MCLAIPYQVIDLQENDSCRIRVGSGVQNCFIGLIDSVKPGDWLVVHAGFAVEKISPEDARENLELINRYIFAKDPADKDAKAESSE